MNLNTDNNAVTLLDAGAAIAAPKNNPHAESRAYAIVPGDHRIEYLERVEEPQRKKGIILLQDADSFIEYFNRHKGDENATYASIDPAGFVGILNEHGTTPDWRDFGCKYTPKYSKEWIVWNARNKQDFDGNEAFAYWLEDNLQDVIEPPNASLMEIAINFKVNSNAAFSNAVRLGNGNTELNYTNAVEGSSSAGTSGKVAIPEMIKIDIPVFEGRDAKKYNVSARFRYRLNNGSLKIKYELVRPHKVLEAAFTEMVDHIATKTNQPVLYGTP